MLSRVVLSLALMAASFVPVMAVPLVQRQSAPSPTTVLALNQTEAQTYGDLIDGFLL